MNDMTKQIARRFDVDMQEARAIQSIAECCLGINYSKMTIRAISALLNEAKDMYEHGENCGCDN